MSETIEAIEAAGRPRGRPPGRPPRAEAVANQRRRRSAGTLNRMAQMRLDSIPEVALNLRDYVYRWIDDKPGRLRNATKLDDYDFVTVAELGAEFNPENTDGESSEHITMFAEESKGGKPIYTHLCRKPRAFWEEDNEEIVRRREAMMEGRVYHAEDTEERDLKKSVSYVPEGVKMGGAAERRRGPVNFK